MAVIDSSLKSGAVGSYHVRPHSDNDFTILYNLSNLRHAFKWRVREDMYGWCSTGLSKKMDGIWNRYNLKSTGRICTFGFLKYSEKFKVLDLP